MAPPDIEAEREWFVELDVPATLSAAQLGAIRDAHPPYGALGLAPLREALNGLSVVLLGPYWPPRIAREHRDRLRTLGLVAEVVGK